MTHYFSNMTKIFLVVSGWILIGVLHGIDDVAAAAKSSWVCMIAGLDSGLPVVTHRDIVSSDPSTFRKFRCTRQFESPEHDVQG